MKKVLILCTGNSCRSIMAEALINHYLGDKYKACSAGVEPSVINPWAVRVLTELGIDTGEYYSKSVSEIINRDDLDLVITVCDHAKESCPVFHKPIPQVHLGIEDPAPYTACPEEEALMAFRQARTDVLEVVVGYLERL